MNPAKLNLNRVLQAGMILLTLGVVCLIGMLLYQRSKVHQLTVAAGSRTGESYIICSAVKKVVERHYPNIRMSVVETGGTVENLRLMEEGRAQMAMAQADVLAGPAARLVAVMYDDTFQLLTRRDSTVRSFAELRGKKIGLPQSGGQFQSFLRVAAHFGLQRADFEFTGSNDVEADKAFESGGADAIFRVRALGNPSIQRLVNDGNMRLVRIEHAAAMKITQPAFEPSVIPAGAYLGNPAEPAEDLPSISVHRTLLASSAVEDQTVRNVTGVVIERRDEIAREIPNEVAEVRLLLAQVRRPDLRLDLGPAIHPGAVQYYEKDKPSFILAHADYMGLLLTVVVMVSSWVWELRAWLESQQKNIADAYSKRVVGLISSAREARTEERLEEIRGELLGILTAAVGDLDADRLSEESFHSFRAILQIGLEVVRDSFLALRPIMRWQ